MLVKVHSIDKGNYASFFCETCKTELQVIIPEGKSAFEVHPHGHGSIVYCSNCGTKSRFKKEVYYTK